MLVFKLCYFQVLLKTIDTIYDTYCKHSNDIFSTCYITTLSYYN